MEEAQRQVMIIALENSPKKMHALIGEKSRFYNLMQTELARAVDVMMARANLVPRSLVDEAEGEIWRSKKICFSWLAAPFDSCPIPPFKIYTVFRGKLSSNSSSNLEISAVGEKEKPIRKDERRKDLEVICHSGLNNFCNMIVPLAKS